MTYQTSSLTLEESIGQVLKVQRLRHGLTIAQVADQASISRGMLSKIENGQTMAAMDTLARLARVLGVPMGQLFSMYDSPEQTAQHIKKGHGMEVVRRGTKSGHTYHLLAYGQGPTKLFEPFLISMDDDSHQYPVFQHPGTEFLYMLEGVLEYRVGSSSYRLESGDSLTFEGETPHGPDKLVECPIKFLSLTVYPQSTP